MTEVDLAFMPEVNLSRNHRTTLLPLLKKLIKEQRIVTHEELMAECTFSKGALEMAIYNLRRKLRNTDYEILSHRGIGYSIVQRKSADVPLQPDQ